MTREGARDQAQDQHVADWGSCLTCADLLETADTVRSPAERNNDCYTQVGSGGCHAEESAVVGGLEADCGDNEEAENGACPRETCPLGLKSWIAIGRGRVV